LPVTVKEALIARAKNLTQIGQLEPALKLLLQVVVSGNCCGLMPVSATLLMAIGAAPVFVKVTVWAALVVFTV
jgi:hypothetical protein